MARSSGGVPLIGCRRVTEEASSVVGVAVNGLVERIKRMWPHSFRSIRSPESVDSRSAPLTCGGRANPRRCAELPIRVTSLHRVVLAFLIPLATLLAACDDGGVSPGKAGTRDDKGRVVLTVAYSPEKAQLFERLVAEFNKQSQRYAVQATKLEMADLLALALEGRFGAISPDSAVWLGPLDQAWLAGDPKRSPLVGTLSRYALSPVVIATWQGEAKKMGYPERPVGWAELVARATADPNFRWSHPSTTTAAGLLTVAAEFYAAAGKTSHLTKEDLSRPSAREYVRRVEQTVQQYGGESEDQVLARLLDRRSRALDAFVGQEALVVRFNRQARDERLLAIYPKEGTLWMDHPLALLEGPWLAPEHRRAFQELAEFLRSPTMQRVVLQEGYRPVDLRISLDDADSQIKLANGVDPSQPQTMLQMPAYSVLESIRNAWALLKRPANIYLVADVSGSMEGEKLRRAKEALLSFVGQVGSESDRLALATFSSDVREVVALGALAENRGRLTAATNGLQAGGNTALYDAILYASERLHGERQEDRINAVLVMTDGKENASRRVRARGDPLALVGALQELERKSGTPVLVFAVAYGEDADFAVLQQISESTRGQAYRGNPETIRKLYQLLSAFF